MEEGEGGRGRKKGGKRGKGRRGWRRGRGV